MKKAYMKPQIEVEVYTLNQDIAGNCFNVVNDGPGIGGHTECEGYIGPFMQGTAPASTYNVNFYEDTSSLCDCYTTGGGNGFWTS